MAKAYGKYTRRRDGHEEDSLCFICAARAAVLVDRRKDPFEYDIYFETDGYEYHKCADCGAYINDRVEI